MQKIIIILAGGQSRRMGKIDKAEVRLCGTRLIDHIIRKTAHQADRLMLSGKTDYGTGLKVIRDLQHGPQGPVAAIYAAAIWLQKHGNHVTGFYTVPVDGPFLPADLVSKLYETRAPTIASDDDGLHPTYGYWTLAALKKAWPVFADHGSISLRALAKECGASHCHWPGKNKFFNINTPSDIEKASKAAL